MCVCMYVCIRVLHEHMSVHCMYKSAYSGQIPPELELMMLLAWVL